MTHTLILSECSFGNVHATFLLAKEMMKAGASIIQIENQVSDAKQCGHQDGKVTVPRRDFIEKLRAVRMAFEELGIEDVSNQCRALLSLCDTEAVEKRALLLHAPTLWVRPSQPLFLSLKNRET